MTPSRWSGFPPPAAPRRVQGGVVARSTRGDIGEQWWSRRFVQVLESFALGTRLTRGRNYARRGQVVSLEVASGQVRATVQGSRRTPYRVTVGLAPFSELVWAKVEVTLAEQAIHSARLLAGELPAELEEVFATAGAPLFPQRASDLAMTCSCPDQAVPCKHLAATFYLLAESFDEDPFRILAWRGRERQPLLTRLRELRGAAPSGTEDATGAASAPRRGVGSAMALDDGASGDGASGDEVPAGAGFPPGAAFGFWESVMVPELPTHPELPADLLLRQLPVPGAVLGGEGLASHLRPLYARMGAPGSEGSGTRP